MSSSASSFQSLASTIEHTLLKPEATSDQIRHLCEEAIKHRFHGVCVNPLFVRSAKALVGDSVRVVSVVGFPLGASASQTKAFETSLCVDHGADEIDMVLSVGALKEGHLESVAKDIRAVVVAARHYPVKVIIETALLNEKEKVLACKIAEESGAAFVKTSTGFSGGGATVEDVILMKNSVSAKMQIKASGGIKTTEQALALIRAGATRLGTSSGVQLIQGLQAQGGY